MELIYFIEINIICIVILVLLLKQIGRKSKENTIDIWILKKIIMVTLALCIFDTVVVIIKGTSLSTTVNIPINIAVIGKYISMGIISYLWMLYIYIQLNLIKNLRDKNIIIWSIPLIITSILVMISPITNFMFSIDEQNIYHREDGIILYWIIIWAYVIISITQARKVIHKEKNLYKKQEIQPLVHCSIPAIIGSIIQMSISGVGSIQIGIVLAILILFLDIQKNQIVVDMLTGINNRNGFNKFLYSTMTFNQNILLNVFMIDLNDFKKINDIQGHIVGDRALQESAEILQKVVSKVRGKYFLSRYGGDEFTIIVYDCEEKEIKRLYDNLLVAFNERNAITKESYELKISIGKAFGICFNARDVEDLLITADIRMYENKKDKNKKKVVLNKKLDLL